MPDCRPPPQKSALATKKNQKTLLRSLNKLFLKQWKCFENMCPKGRSEHFFTEPLAVSQPTASAELSCADIFTLHSSPLVAASPVSLSVDGNEGSVWFFNNTLKHMRASLPSAHSQIPTFTFQKQFLNDAIHAGWHILRLPRLALFIGDDGCGMCVYECAWCVERTSEGSCRSFCLS